MIPTSAFVPDAGKVGNLARMEHVMMYSAGGESKRVGARAEMMSNSPEEGIRSLSVVACGSFVSSRTELFLAMRPDHEDHPPPCLSLSECQKRRITGPEMTQGLQSFKCCFSW